MLNLPHNPARPLRIMRQAAVCDTAYRAALRGINRVLATAQATSLVPVQDLNVWRMPHYRERGEELLDEQSVDWYMERSYVPSRCHLDGGATLALMMDELWQKHEPHYDVCITRYPLWDNGVCYGTAVRNFGCVVSTYAMYQSYRGEKADRMFETLVMHEVGHVFGLVPDARTKNVTENLGRHCTDQCVMRQGVTVDQWWEMADNARFCPPFCPLCQHDLHNNFHHH